MDKIIARKRWFFLFSLILTVPGLFFILATPFSNGAIGLRFSIDFTGGTAWEFRPAAGATTEAVRLAVRRRATGWTGKKPVVEVQLVRI